MTTLEDFKKGILHALLVGYPGSGKTGSCAALANSGYNLWIIDFDRNPDPLIEFVEPEFKKNVHIAQFFDPKEMKKFEVRGKLVDKLVPKGTPMAYSHAIRQLNTWVPELGANDVVIIDSLTRLGDACMLRILSMQNRVAAGPRIQDWGMAQEQQLSFLTQVREECRGCNVLVMAHLKVIEPRHLDDLIEAADDSSKKDFEEDLKKVMEKSISMVPTRMYPSALGKVLPQDLGSHFPYILRYELKEGLGNKVSRIISTEASSLFDVKVPLANVKKEYPIESGLLEIFSLARDTK